MSYTCEILDQQPQPTLTIHTRASEEALSQTLGKAFSEIISYIQSLGEQPAGAAFVAYFNMDMKDLDIEIGFPLMKSLPGKDKIKPGELPHGKVATCLYTGGYNTIAPAYSALNDYVKEQGYETTGISYEFYYDTPDTPPEKTRTLIMFPLKS